MTSGLPSTIHICTPKARNDAQPTDTNDCRPLYCSPDPTDCDAIGRRRFEECGRNRATPRRLRSGGRRIEGCIRLLGNTKLRISTKNAKGHVSQLAALRCVLRSSWRLTLTTRTMPGSARQKISRDLSNFPRRNLFFTENHFYPDIASCPSDPSPAACRDAR